MYTICDIDYRRDASLRMRVNEKGNNEIKRM